jgi:hypothetical protein
MKKILVVTLLFQNSFCISQVAFTKGYYVTGKDTLSGYIEERETYSNTELKYKKERDGEPVNISFESVSAIHLSDLNEFYVKREVDIDKKPLDVGQLENTVTKRISHETVFLKNLVRGKVELLRYKDEDLRVHFFYQNEQETKELNLVRFLNKDGKMVEFMEYKQQLKNLFSDCENAKINVVDFSEKALINAFRKYNQCVGGFTYDTNRVRHTRSSLFAIVGLSNNSLTYDGNDNQGSIARLGSYNSSINYNIGFGLNFKKKKAKPTDFALELIYRGTVNFSSTPIDPTIGRLNNINMSFSHSNLNMTFKYSFLRNSVVMPYVKIGIGVSYLLNSNTSNQYPDFLNRPITVNPLVDLNKLGYNLVGGVGISVKRFYAETRIDHISHGAAAGTRAIVFVNSIGFNLGYKIL